MITLGLAGVLNAHCPDLVMSSATAVMVHPHLFRTIAATTIVREAAEKIAMARDLLTHTRLDTTMDYYTKAQTVLATRRHTALLAKLRTEKN